MSMAEDSSYAVCFLSLIHQCIELVFHILHMTVGQEDFAAFCFYDLMIFFVAAVTITFDSHCRYAEFFR